MTIQVYSLTVKPFYSNQYNNQHYTHIIEINKEPLGPLKTLVKRINRPKISPFNINTFPNNTCETSCMYAIHDINNSNEIMCLSKITDLYAFILQHADLYTIDDKLAKMMQKSNIINNQERILFNIIYNDNKN